MTLLAHAIALASHAHETQQDKAGAPYILHPLRIIQKMHSEAEMITAVLHDVVEDTPWTLEQLQAEGFSSAALEDSVTHRPDETYEAYLVRAATNPIGRKVKLVDLEDDMALRHSEKIRLEIVCEIDVGPCRGIAVEGVAGRVEIGGTNGENNA